MGIREVLKTLTTKPKNSQLSYDDDEMANWVKDHLFYLRDAVGKPFTSTIPAHKDKCNEDEKTEEKVIQQTPGTEVERAPFKPRVTVGGGCIVEIVPGASIYSKYKKYYYDPDGIACGTVIWHNADNAIHTATSGRNSTPDGRFDTSLIPPGQDSKPITIPPGGGAYFCTLHPFMVGRVG